MKEGNIAAGVAHGVPADMRKALAAHPDARATWNGLTPLARNEWICWTISVKKPETRAKHVERAMADLGKGKRRPCCWMGCVHRTDKPASPSQKYILDKRSQKKS